MTAGKITMTTIQQPKLVQEFIKLQKCSATTSKGLPCNNKRSMVRNCDDKGVCKKHLKRISEFKPRLNVPNKLPENVLKLLPYELWLDIFEFIPKKQCLILYPINGMIANGETEGGMFCSSCGKKYTKKDPGSVLRG
jgi:hypothetical protein